MAQLEYATKCHHGKGLKAAGAVNGYTKQQAFAEFLGIAQSTLSEYLRSPVLKDDFIKMAAAKLKVSEDYIRNFPDDEEATTIIIENNTFRDNEKVSNIGNYSVEDNSVNHFNPVDKIVELCEKLLAAEKEKIALLERLLKEKE